jgi:hypothetical protein
MTSITLHRPWRQVRQHLSVAGFRTLAREAEIRAAYRDLGAATTVGGQIRYASLLLELLHCRQAGSVAALRLEAH